MTQPDLTPMDRQVIHTFQGEGPILTIWRDAKSDAPGRRGDRYSLVYQTLEPATETRVAALGAKLRSFYPDFAWNVFTPDSMDDHARALVWTAPSVAPSAGAPLVNVLEFCRRAFLGLDRVVAVTCSPDLVPLGGAAYATVVLRTPMGIPPLELLRLVDGVATRLRFEVPEIREVQACPELNFPPTGVGQDDDDPWLELKAEIMRRVVEYRMVEAVWFVEPPQLLVEGGGPDGPPTCYVLGEDSAALAATVRAAGARFAVARDLESVPREAACIFNPITRLLKAEGEKDTATAEAIRAKIRAAASSSGAALANAPAGMDRNDPTTHVIKCRWCTEPVPASTNPAYLERCLHCGAMLSATTIPTKSKAMPLISIWSNPDGSCFFEFVFEPPVPGRYDLSKVVRCVVPGQLFDQHPMGKRKP